MIRIAFCQTNRLFILLERAELEIRLSMANCTFKMKMDIDRHSPRLMPNNCQHLDPPHFSLPTTVKQTLEVKTATEYHVIDINGNFNPSRDMSWRKKPIL